MSNLRHRQPAWRWSVVLLSTALLLSPAAARALLCALASAQQAGVVATVPSHQEPGDHRQPAQHQAPRRSEEEDAAALRAAVELAGDEIDGTRLDPSAPATDFAASAAVDVPPGAAALAFLVPSRADVLVPDAGPAVSPAFASAPPGPSLRRAATRALPSRAPPASV